MKIDDALRDFHSTDVREGPALLQGVFSLPLRKVGFECLHVEENTSLSINWYQSTGICTKYCGDCRSNVDHGLCPQILSKGTES